MRKIFDYEVEKLLYIGKLIGNKIEKYDGREYYDMHITHNELQEAFNFFKEYGYKATNLELLNTIKESSPVINYEQVSDGCIIQIGDTYTMPYNEKNFIKKHYVDAVYMFLEWDSMEYLSRLAVDFGRLNKVDSCLKMLYETGSFI